MLPEKHENKKQSLIDFIFSLKLLVIGQRLSIDLHDNNKIISNVFPVYWNIFILKH